jgi:hypothetical protein
VFELFKKKKTVIVFVETEAVEATKIESLLSSEKGRLTINVSREDKVRVNILLFFRRH